MGGGSPVTAPPAREFPSQPGVKRGKFGGAQQDQLAGGLATLGNAHREEQEVAWEAAKQKRIVGAAGF
jgi:hypothetical protein